MSATRVAGKQLFKWRQWWSDHPDIMGTSCVFAVGLVTCALNYYVTDKRGPMNYAHKRYYTVVRDSEVDPSKPPEYYN